MMLDPNRAPTEFVQWKTKEISSYYHKPSYNWGAPHCRSHNHPYPHARAPAFSWCVPVPSWPACPRGKETSSLRGRRGSVGLKNTAEFLLSVGTTGGNDLMICEIPWERPVISSQSSKHHKATVQIYFFFFCVCYIYIYAIYIYISYIHISYIYHISIIMCIYIYICISVYTSLSCSFECWLPMVLNAPVFFPGASKILQAKGNWQKVELLMRLEGKATFLLCFHGNDKMPKAGGKPGWVFSKFASWNLQWWALQSSLAGFEWRQGLLWLPYCPLDN